MPKKQPTKVQTNKKRRPARDPDARQSQLVSYAVDLVEQRLLDGTATAQEVVYFLKLGSHKEEAELEKLRLETEMIKAKTENYRAQQTMESLFTNAINAMKKYSGNGVDDDDEEFEE